MSQTPRRTVTCVLIVASLVLATAPGAWATVKPRASLTDIENDVMCTVCHEPLAVAQSLEADQERTVIRGLIAQGLTKAQIERALVAEYGVDVLGRPPAHGVNLLIYILPPAILAAGIAILAVTLPRWRRRTRAAAAEPHVAPPPLDPADSARLEHELSQFRG
jgi:cytochrome c-type biogenesis protein CcmH